ncbi:MAG: hypothetical protein Q8N30_08160, partial [Methylococcales bacterium]|nr:hypothetical protein [Methylococcales bacterium]
MYLDSIQDLKAGFVEASGVEKIAIAKQVIEERKSNAELQKNLPKGTIAGNSVDIENLANKILNGEIPANEKQAVRYSIVGDDEAEKIKQATDLDVKGYKHTVDSFGIRHAISHHGDDKKEAKHGQIAITPNDISLIPEIVKSPDNIEPAGKDANGNDLIRYSKKQNGTIFYVEEVRVGRLELVSKTMWKTRPNVAMPDNSQQLTPEATGGNLPHDTETIAQTKDESNNRDKIERLQDFLLGSGGKGEYKHVLDEFLESKVSNYTYNKQWSYQYFGGQWADSYSGRTGKKDAQEALELAKKKALDDYNNLQNKNIDDVIKSARYKLEGMVKSGLFGDTEQFKESIVNDML